MSSDVAVYLPSLGGGGAERVAATLAAEFAARSLRVDLVLARADGPYVADIPRSVRIVDLGASRVSASLPALVKYLRAECPRAMLATLDHANVVAVAARFLSRTRTRLVLRVANTLTVNASNSGSFRSRLLPMLVSLMYRRADAIVTVSEGVRQDLLRTTGLSRSQVHTIYNPVVTRDLSRLAEEPLNHPWFEDGQPPVIVAVGRLVKQKDVATLLRAFARVRASRHVRLLILGEGPERLSLEALAQQLRVASDVQFLGFVRNPFAYMRRAALYVLSSAWEGLPGTLIQAMACGTPVVSTDCPSGPSEILENGKWGRLVRVGDDEALARAIEKTLDAPDKPDVRARAQFFSVERSIAQYLAVLMGGHQT